MVEHFTVPDPLPGQDGQNGAAVLPEDGQGVAVADAAAQAGPAAAVRESGALGEVGTLSEAGALNDGIGGMSALRGLMLYGAILTFAGLYAYFMVVISTSRHGVKPSIDATLISAAAALSGVLGSAFALKIGVAPSAALVNRELATHRQKAADSGVLLKITAVIRNALSLEPSGVNAKSWPLTFGIWAYAAVASAVVVVYILNQNETPGTVKALAVTFGGYVIALVNLAYGLTKQGNG
jgi:hypothetical protein